jgi:gag-polypeptide of LTR copia-type
LFILSLQLVEMPPRKDPKGKTPATAASPQPAITTASTTQAVPDQGLSIVPIRSPSPIETASDVDPSHLDFQGQLDALAKQNQESIDRLAMSFSSKFDSLLQRLSETPLKQQSQPANQHTSHTSLPLSLDKLPTVPTLTKLKGRENYKIWTHEIQNNAEIYGVWDAIMTPQAQTALPTQYQAFAYSLIFRNTDPLIQTALTQFSTAFDAWNYLDRQYNKLNIAQLVQQVHKLLTLQYDSFSSIESYQQHVQTISQQLLDYGSPANAFNALLASLILLNVGRAIPAVRANIEDGINSQQPKDFEDIIGYIFERLYSFRPPKGQTPTNPTNPASKQPEVRIPSIASTSSSPTCSICGRTHGNTCFVLYPLKAPAHMQAFYKHENAAYMAKQAKNKEEENRDDSSLVGLLSDTTQHQGAIYLDSGTAKSITPNRSQFIEFVPLSRPYQFKAANGTTLQAFGKGTILINSPSPIHIRNVYYAPKAPNTLISTRWFLQRRMQFQYSEVDSKLAELVINQEKRHIFDLDISGPIPRIITNPTPASLSPSINSITVKPRIITTPIPRIITTPIPASLSPSINSITVKPPQRAQVPRSRYQPGKLDKPASIPRATLDEWHVRFPFCSRTNIRKLHAARLLYIIKAPPSNI